MLQLTIPASDTSTIDYPSTWVSLSEIWGIDDDGLEGISFDRIQNKIYLAREVGSPTVAGPTVYTLNYPTAMEFADNSTLNVLPIQDFSFNDFGGQAPCNLNNSVDFAGLHHLSSNPILFGSGLQDHFILLSERWKSIYEVAENGDIIGSFNLCGAPQAEGLTMDLDGNIYIVSEPNLFYKLTPPMVNAPTPTFSASNLGGSSYTLSSAHALAPGATYCWRVKNNTTNLWSDFSMFSISGLDCISRDKSALNALYLANVNDNIPWDLSTPVSTYTGITVNNDGCVTHLEYKLHGSLPTPLSGTIPASIGNLEFLEVLDFEQQDLTGEIPPEVGQLTNLLKFRIYSSEMTGNIPTELLGIPNLKCLNLIFGDFSGVVPIELWTKSSLEDIGLTYFSGEIPASISTLTNLRWLTLIGPGFTGIIPPELGTLPSLELLFLGGTSMIGGIPPELGDSQSLTNITIVTNTSLGGEIPAELGNLQNLNFLYLTNNGLSGCFHPNLKNLCSVTTQGIDYGNSFDASWSDFCISDTGMCCPQDLMLHQHPAGHYIAEQQLTSISNIQTNDHVEYHAGNKITLDVGFRLEGNSPFRATIEGWL